jgi:hypothetical protein
MGFLNSARFLGMAFGPVMATTILGDGLPPRPVYMYAMMAVISMIAAVVLYLTHIKKTVREEF